MLVDLRPMPQRSRLYTYQEAGERLGYSAGYVRWLTRTGELGYIVKSWRRGWLLRKKRLIPEIEIAAFEYERLKRTFGRPMQKLLEEMSQHQRRSRSRVALRR
jgi:hypothetical protein